MAVELSLNSKRKLLKLARQSIESCLRGNTIPEVVEDEPQLQAACGAFVTLRKNKQLRGCIGRITTDLPLYQTVMRMAIAAATEDFRFIPLELDELNQTEIEISVLSPPQLIKDINEIKEGVHGVIVERGSYCGVYLPQVWHETGWNKEEFLSSLCAHKAGLEPYAWKKPGTLIYIFTADIFSEGELL